MSESQEQPKKLDPTKPDSTRGVQLTLGLLCFLFFLDGLSNVFTTSGSGSHADQTLRLVFGVVQMVFGGVGAAIYGWSLMRNRT
jgi:hypothetical protein